MSLFSGLFSGNDAANAATDAARIQQLAGLKAQRGIDQGFDEAGNQLTTGFEQAQQGLNPFGVVGQNALQNVNLLTDRQAQADFLANDPITQQNRENTLRSVAASSAAGGGIGSGNFVQANADANFGVSQQALANQQANIANGLNFGLGLAGQQANLSTGLGQGLAGLTQTKTLQNADLTTGIGASQAAGTIGAQNARTEAKSGALNAGLGLLGTVFPAVAPVAALAKTAINT